MRSKGGSSDSGCTSTLTAHSLVTKATFQVEVTAGTFVQVAKVESRMS